jgi:hypothetical protein
MPVWPQTRTLAAGARAGIAIPVTQAGNVMVTLARRNGPLTATLITPENKTVPVPLSARPRDFRSA